MRCEVVAVGTELLLGQIVDTNSAWIGEQLAPAGIDSHFQTKVGDNLGRIVDGCIRQALERSDAVIVCGGLGPTQDDITRDAIAEVMGVPLVRDDEVAERDPRTCSPSRGRAMPDEQPAPGGRAGGRHGRSRRARHRARADLPGRRQGDLRRARRALRDAGDARAARSCPTCSAAPGAAAVIASRVLRTWGESESGLAELLAPRIARARRARQPDPRLPRQRHRGPQGAPHRQGADRRRRRRVLSAEEARAAAAPRRPRVRRRRRDDGVGGARPAARARASRSALAESVTGGLVGARLTARARRQRRVPGRASCPTPAR